jgi:hypothetical protein
MRLASIRDVLLCLALLGGFAATAVATTRTIGAALGANDPCVAGYRGPAPGSCTRPLPTAAGCADGRDRC